MRLANLLGAVATGLSDRMQDAAWDTARLDGSDSTALISLLDFSPAGTVRALSRICGLTHSGGVRLVNRLAVAGYVERGPGANARSVTINLTPSGRRVALTLRAARHAAIVGTMTRLTQAQRADLATDVRFTDRCPDNAPTGSPDQRRHTRRRSAVPALRLRRMRARRRQLSGRKRREGLSTPTVASAGVYGVGLYDDLEQTETEHLFPLQVLVANPLVPRPKPSSRS